MSNIDEKISSTILMKTLKRLMQNPLTNIGCTVGLVDKHDIYNWKCTLSGPNDSPYRGGLFKLFIKFDKNFPIVGPVVIFDTPIYHMNINPIQGEKPLGYCCISTVNFWTPDTSIEDLLVSVFALFYAANPESAYGLDIREEFETNKQLYDKKVAYFTKKYAVPESSSKDLDKWDFNYDNNIYK